MPCTEHREDAEVMKVTVGWRAGLSCLETGLWCHFRHPGAQEGPEEARGTQHLLLWQLSLGRWMSCLCLGTADGLWCFLCSSSFRNSCICLFCVRISIYLLPRPASKFQEGMVRDDGCRRSLCWDEESRGPQWKPNIHILLSAFHHRWLGWKRDSAEKKNLTLKKLVYITFLMHIRSNKLLLVLLKLDTTWIIYSFILISFNISYRCGCEVV